jgi:hypothetical protein
LSSRDGFVQVKCIFSTTSEAEIFSKLSWIETEANGGHWGDRTLNQMWSRHDWTRLVSGSSCLAWDARASHRCVWSSPRGTTMHARLIGHGGASGHDRPDASGREWVLTRIDRTLALWHLVSSSSTSGRMVSNANRDDRTPRRVRSILVDVSGHSSA